MKEKLVKIKSKVNIFDTERAPAFLASLAAKGLIPVKYDSLFGTIYCRKDEPKKLKYVYDHRKFATPAEKAAFIKEGKEGYSLLYYDEYDTFIFYGDIDAADFNTDYEGFYESRLKGSRIWFIVSLILILFFPVMLGIHLYRYFTDPISFYLNEHEIVAEILLTASFLTLILSMLLKYIRLKQHIKDKKKHKLLIDRFMTILVLFFLVAVFQFSGLFLINYRLSIPDRLTDASMKYIVDEDASSNFITTKKTGVILHDYAEISQSNDDSEYKLTYTKTLNHNIAENIYRHDEKEWKNEKIIYFSENQCSELNILKGFCYETEGHLFITVIGEKDYLSVSLSHDSITSDIKDNIYEIIKNRDIVLNIN